MSIAAFIKRDKKNSIAVFKNAGIDQSGLLPRCNADTTKHGYSSNGPILGATIVF